MGEVLIAIAALCSSKTHVASINGPYYNQCFVQQAECMGKYINAKEKKVFKESREEYLLKQMALCFDGGKNK
jgi:hypothetical protein